MLTIYYLVGPHVAPTGRELDTPALNIFMDDSFSEQSCCLYLMWN